MENFETHLAREVIRALKTACAAHPEQRVTQVLVNALGSDPFYVEDPEAARKLYEYAAK